MEEKSIRDGRGKIGRCEQGAKHDKVVLISMGEIEAVWSIGPAVNEEVEWTEDRQSAARSLSFMA